MDENRRPRQHSDSVASHHWASKHELTHHPSEKQHRYTTAKAWSEDYSGAVSPGQMISPGCYPGEVGIRKTLLGALIASVPKERSPLPVSPLVLPKPSPGLFLTPNPGYTTPTPNTALPRAGTPSQGDPLYSLFNSPIEDKHPTDTTPLHHVTNHVRPRQTSNASAKRDAELLREIMAPHRKRNLPLSMEDSLERAETFSKKPEPKKNRKRKAAGDVLNVFRVDSPEPERSSSASASTSSDTPQKKRKKRDDTQISTSTASSSPKECIVVRSRKSSTSGSPSPSPHKSGDEKAEFVLHHQQRKVQVKPTKFQVMLQKTKEQERQKARDMKNLREMLHMQK